MEKKPLHLLILEDSPDDAELAVKELEREGFTVEWSRVDTEKSFREAIEKKPDLILADYVVPSFSGTDALKMQQKIAPDIPLIIVSGKIGEEVAVECMKSGATDYVLKDRLFRLGPAVKRALEEAEEHRARKSAEEHIKHLNSVLKAIRRVNQLAVFEKDRDILLQKACDALIEARGYDGSWLGFLKDKKTFARVVGSGLREDVSRFIEHVMGGDHSPCIKNALAQKHMLMIVDKSKVCGDCFFKSVCIGREAAIIRVEHAGRFFGLLAILFALDVTTDEEERGLLKEVASDIAFALRSMELEEEREQADEALLESEEKYRSLTDDVLDSSAAGIFILDSDFRVVWVNKALEDYFGLKRDEIIGKDKRQLIRERIKDIFEDSDSFTNKVFTTYDDNTYIERFECHVLPNGERKERWLEHRSQPIQLGLYTGGRIEHYYDITEQKKAEDSLRESEEKMRTILDSVPDVVLQLDTNLEILWANKATIKLNPNAVGQLCYKALPGINDVCPGCPIVKALKTGQIERGVVHLQSVTGVGESYWDDIGIPIKDAQGKITSIVKFARNITEKKKAEEEMKKVQAELIQTQKMEAIGTLAGGIAHDFNNILSLIMGYTELSMMNLPEDSPARDNMDKLFKAGERARDLVKQILTFSRQREEEKKPLQIHLIVKEALKLLRPSLPTTIEIRQNIASTGMVMADPTQMHQVIMNLSTNAYHAMQEKGGVLEVSLQNVECGMRNADLKKEEKESKIQIPKSEIDLDPGPYIRFTVSDTGHGIEKKDIDRIFEPYYTKKEKTGGTGMGLAVVHGIVKSYSGAITVYSEPGKGTTFNVFLPRIEETKVETETEEMGPIPIGKERILLVDDEPFICEIGKGMLEHLGYKVTTRTSSIEALEAFKAKPDKFDLVITDMTMPKMTGDVLAKELMGVRPDIPIILCTGFSERINEEKAKAMGIRRLVMKPIVQREMAKAVREALD